MEYLVIFLAIISCFLLSLLVSNRGLFLPWNSPLLRLLPTIYLKSHELYNKMTLILAENKGTVLFKTSWFTNLDVLVTSDPANVQYVMNSKFSIYQRGSEFKKAFDFLGEAVFIQDYDQWREEKKFTHGFYKESQFHKSTLRIIRRTLEEGLIPVLDHCSQQNQELDLQGLFNRYMLDATCLMATGFDLGSLRIGLPKCLLLEAMDDMAEAVFSRHILPERVWKLQRWLGIGKERKMAEACRTLNQTLADFVSRKYEQVTAPNQEPGGDFDVLKFYMAEAAASDDAKASTKHAEKVCLAANIMTLLFAGRDTSAALLTWFFHLISTNPSVRDNILEEIRQNSPPQKHLFSNVEELNKLVYLHCALYESLRLFPTAPVIIRDPTQEDVLPSGDKVGKTTKVILCTYAMGRKRDIWGEDCHEFKPERWKAGKGGIKHVPSSSFLAFGSGPRACPGKELGFTRMKAVAATMLHNFHVEVSEGQTISPSVSALLTLKHGLKARVSSRWM